MRINDWYSDVCSSDFAVGQLDDLVLGFPAALLGLPEGVELRALLMPGPLPQHRSELEDKKGCDRSENDYLYEIDVAHPLTIVDMRSGGARAPDGRTGRCRQGRGAPDWPCQTGRAHV